MGAVSSLHEHPCKRRSSRVRDRTTRRQPAVRGEHVLARHGRREERAVRESKKTAHEPTEEDDEVELEQRERSRTQPLPESSEESGPSRGPPATITVRFIAARVDPDADRQRNSRCGSQNSAVSTPIWAADASSVSTAASGMASALIWSPKTETDIAAHSRMNAGCLRSGALGAAVALAALTPAGSGCRRSSRSHEARPQARRSERASSSMSSSDVVSPLIVRASMWTREPLRMPTIWSPEADCIVTRPAATDPRRWSPEAVCTVTDDSPRRP